MERRRSPVHARPGQGAATSTEASAPGLVVRRDGRRALLLPEVAAMLEAGPTAMLDACCRKASLPSDAWRDPRCALWVFRTCRFVGRAA